MAQEITAVEWFAREINKINVSTEARLFIEKLKNQAKEMENQQMIRFAEQYNMYLLKCKKGVRGSVVEMDAEQYYNEAFKK